MKLLTPLPICHVFAHGTLSVQIAQLSISVQWQTRWLLSGRTPSRQEYRQYLKVLFGAFCRCHHRNDDAQKPLFRMLPGITAKLYRSSGLRSLPSSPFFNAIARFLKRPLTTCLPSRARTAQTGQPNHQHAAATYTLYPTFMNRDTLLLQRRPQTHPRLDAGTSKPRFSSEMQNRMNLVLDLSNDERRMRKRRRVDRHPRQEESSSVSASSSFSSSSSSATRSSVESSTSSSRPISNFRSRDR
ncbi:hypothetical protein R3P38DRAFT_273946 [Favolaschia claudopus]|uniref:Uncharacterized protein n=1 Tax=Favolaschia claudopus TaxID=2862362 RepID=A0AAV9ZQ18_9AGAR